MGHMKKHMAEGNLLTTNVFHDLLKIIEDEMVELFETAVPWKLLKLRDQAGRRILLQTHRANTSSS